MEDTKTFAADFAQCPICQSGQLVLAYEFEDGVAAPPGLVIHPSPIACHTCAETAKANGAEAIGIAYPVMRLDIKVKVAKGADSPKVGQLIVAQEAVDEARRIFNGLRQKAQGRR